MRRDDEEKQMTQDGHRPTPVMRGRAAHKAS